MNRQLATPGALLLLGGMYLLWWAFASKHGELQESWWDKMQRGSSAGIRQPATPKVTTPQPVQGTNPNTSGGGSDARAM